MDEKISLINYLIEKAKTDKVNKLQFKDESKEHWIFHGRIDFCEHLIDLFNKGVFDDAKRVEQLEELVRDLRQEVLTLREIADDVVRYSDRIRPVLSLIDQQKNEEKE